jgi:Phage protein (N4 Gp49/phage Sf6 gene 66) family
VSDGLRATDAASAAVAVAPRVSVADIEAKIVHRCFATGTQIALLDDSAVIIPTTLAALTICVLVMSNGFSVVGKSAPASPANFNAQLGRDLAYEDAVRQLWPLEGYLLREALHSGPRA